MLDLLNVSLLYHLEIITPSQMSLGLKIYNSAWLENSCDKGPWLLGPHPKQGEKRTHSNLDSHGMKIFE